MFLWVFPRVTDPSRFVGRVGVSAPPFGPVFGLSIFEHSLRISAFPSSPSVPFPTRQLIPTIIAP